MTSATTRRAEPIGDGSSWAERRPGLFDGSLAVGSSPTRSVPSVAVRRSLSGNVVLGDARPRDVRPPERPVALVGGTGGKSAARRDQRSQYQGPPPIPQAARDLLADAGRGLGRAMRASDAADRYATAHLAALRAAAAVLAARARPVRGRRGSAWELIARVAPEFSEWAAFFAAGSAKRQAAEAGLQRLVTAREADDMVRQVGAFLDLVDEALSSGPRQVQRRAF